MQIVKNLSFALVVVLFGGVYIAVHGQSGSGNQPVEMEYGTTDMAYPVRIDNPNGKECGGGIKDKFLPDKVLVYNTPAGGKGHPDNIKFWSTSERVRKVLAAAYGGRLAAAGLTTVTTRVCVGAAARSSRLFAVDDYRYIYLWRRRPIARP